MSGVATATLAAFLVKLKESTRYRGYWVSDLGFTFFMAFLPIMMGRGGDVGIFEAMAGTSNYYGYMLLGACAFMAIDAPLWQMGNWFRREQQIGTLQSIYLTPNGSVEALGGLALFSLFRSCIIAGIPLATGFLWFGLDLSVGVVLALAFLVVGFIPVCGLSLLIGALVLRLKETGALLNALQMSFGFLMGMWVQVTLFPAAVRAVSYALPMTWVASGVRASIMGIPYLTGSWESDFAVLLLHSAVMPLLGVFIFSRVEKGVKQDSGVGSF
jgi:ABC-2 type transport system permease protein